MEKLIDNIAEVRKKHEFITFLILDENTCHCGIVQNVNKRFIVMYDVNKIPFGPLTDKFYEYGDKWWWESGMTLPIDCYIGRDFDIFQDALTMIPMKALSEKPIGPMFSITDQYLKRLKRKRRIELIGD